MKIAVFHNLPSGGAKRALYGFVKYLTTSGHLVDTFVPSTADEIYLPLSQMANNFEVFPVSRSFKGLIISTVRYVPLFSVSFADLEKTQKSIAQKINNGPYDIVLSEQDQFTYSPFFLNFINKPTIYYCQQPSRLTEAVLNTTLQRMQQKNFFGLCKKIIDHYVAKRITSIDRKNASSAKYILANSCFSREVILRSWGLNAFVSYLGIDTDVFRPLRTAKKNFVFSVGACYPHKGFDFILRSLGLVDKNIRPDFVIVSNSIYPPWKKYLEKIALQNHVNLHIKSGVADEALVTLYNEARIFLFSPFLEPFGLATLEAMACGTPVVAVKEGGIRETVIHKETGLLTGREEKAFAESVSTLLSDQREMERMGRNGIDSVRQFWTLEHSGERLLRHLHRAMNC